MLAELLDKLVSIIKKGDALEVSSHPDLPQKLFVAQGGSHQRIDVPPPLRNHRIYDLDDVFALLSDSAVVDGPELYYGEGGVVVLLDRTDGRESATLLFEESARFHTLEELQKARSFSPAEAVKFLRFELHGTGVEPVVQALRRIDFKRSSDGRSHVEHGRESLGRSVEAQVQQADQVPQTFPVTVFPITNAGFRSISVDVTCGVFIDLPNEKVEIRVLSDEIANARNAMAHAVRELLREGAPDVPMFHGIPFAGGTRGVRR